MAEHLDAGLDRAHVPLANAGLQVHEHFVATSRVELAKLLKFKGRLASNGAFESLMRGLPRDLKLRGKRDAFGERSQRRCLTATGPPDLFRNRVER